MNLYRLSTPFALALCLLAAGLALASGGPSANAGSRPSGATQPQWGTDVQVNPTPTRLYTVQRNFSLAVNPTNPLNVVSAYDGQTGINGLTSYAATTDGGQTWAGGHFSNLWDGDLTPYGYNNVAFDNSGTAYLTSLAWGNTRNGYFVLTSTNGLQWGEPRPIAVSDYNTSRSFGALVSDTQQGSPYRGSLYMFWYLTSTKLPYYYGIQARYSRDGGRTWNGDFQVSSPDHAFFDWNPVPVVGPGGVLYVAFEYLANNSIHSDPYLLLNRSTDGGRSWQGDRVMAGGPVVRVGRPDYKKRELTLVGDSNCNLMRVRHFPSIGVSPTNANTLYAVWNDARWEPETGLCGSLARHSDIAFSRSTDAGQTWTAPRRINDDQLGNGVDQFTPTLAVRGDGLIAVTWYDRRYSYYSRQDDIGGYEYDLAYSQSTDGGATWLPNQRVSDHSNDSDRAQDFKGINDLGYRKDIVFGSGSVLASWLGTPLGQFEGDYFVDRGIFGSAVSRTDSPAAPIAGDITWPFCCMGRYSTPARP
jgi:hypothetical protein